MVINQKQRRKCNFGGGNYHAEGKNSVQQKVVFATTAVKQNTFDEYAKVHLLNVLYPLSVKREEMNHDRMLSNYPKLRWAGPCSLPVVVAQSDERHANRA